MTLKILNRAIGGALLAVGVCLSSLAGAADLKPPIVGIVDGQLIMQRSEASRSIQQAIDGQRQALTKEFASREEKLRAADQELAKQRAVLSQDAFAKKRRELEQQVAEFQRDVQSKQRLLEQSVNEAMGTIQTRLLEIIKTVAQDEGLTMVLSRQQVLWNAEKSMDLTPMVLDRLNKELPKVAVKPAGAAPSGKK